MSVCHFSPLSAFTFIRVQVAPLPALSVSGLPGVYLASPQAESMEEKELIFKTKETSRLIFPFFYLI